ncbi:MAG: RluA family pseudouridine synthase [Clostridia bacterium]
MSESEECDIIEVTAELSGERLDSFCARVFPYSRSRFAKLIENGSVLLNSAPSKVNVKIKKGDIVLLNLPKIEVTNIVPENIPLDVVYEDFDIAVINKEKGMVVHPAPGHYTGTLVNAIMYRITDLSGIGGELRPGIVHRIDRFTSGLLVIAKNDFAHNFLSEQLKTHSIERDYYALVTGNIKEDNGSIDAPIGRHPRDRKKMTVLKDGGREAVTHFKVLKRFISYTLLDVSLETGRTHQIRVHMAYINHPIVGDDVYGSLSNKLHIEGQALHAHRLSLVHPRTGKRIEFSAPMPQYFSDILIKLERETKV